MVKAFRLRTIGNTQRKIVARRRDYSVWSHFYKKANIVCVRA